MASSERTARTDFIFNGGAARVTRGPEKRNSSSAPKNNESDPQRGSLSCVRLLPKKSVLRDERRGSAKLLAAGICIERLVIPLSDLRRGASGPVEGRVQKITATLRIPCEPGMRLPARSGPLSNDEADISRSVFAHLLVKGDRFCLAVGRGAGLGFSGGLPKSGKAVGDGAQ